MYNVNGWKDQLSRIEISGEAPCDSGNCNCNCNCVNTLTEYFSYNTLGYPTVYRGKYLTWDRVNKLTSFNGNTFTYDSAGMRLTKNTNTQYTYDGDKLIREVRNGKVIEYIHGLSGIIGFVYDGTPYYYIKDIQGNVKRITDINGHVVASYTYDAWGNHTVYDEFGDATTYYGTIGNINPIRYRGYYYDSETGLYYLQTRYYDPEIGRFISPDSTKYLDPESINGLNLYAYCLNNPAAYTDYTGRFALTTFGIGAIIGIVAFAIVLGGSVQLASNALAGETGSDLWRGVAGAALGSGANALALCLSPFTGGVSLAFAAVIGAGVQTGVDTIETLVRGEEVSLGKTVLELGINFTTTFAGNWLGAKMIPTNSGWFKPQKLLSVFTKRYGQRILLQTAIGAGVSGTINFARKFDWNSVDWKKLISVIPMPVVPIYLYF